MAKTTDKIGFNPLGYIKRNIGKALVTATVIGAGLGLFTNKANGQDLTLEGRLTNRSNQPVSGAKVTSNTPSSISDITDANGNYYLNLTEFPTNVQTTEYERGILKPGPITRKVYDMSGRVMDDIDHGELNFGGIITGMDETIDGLKPENVYLQVLTDKDGNTAVKKFFSDRSYAKFSQDVLSQIVKEDNMLKSGSTTASDLFGYKVVVSGNTFDDTEINLEFPKDATYHYKDLIVNEFITKNGDLKDLYFGLNPVTVDITDLFSNDNETQYSANSGNVSFAKENDKILMTYTPNAAINENITITATDADDASITHEADFKAMKGKTLTGHAREVEWGRSLEGVLAVANDGQNLYHAYSDKDGNFEIIVPSAGNYDVYMELDGFRTTSNKYRVKDGDVTVFKRNNLFPDVFTKDPRFMDIFESMCHDAQTNYGLSANFFQDDDDSTKFEINQNTTTQYMEWNDTVKPEWLEGQRVGIMKYADMTDGLITPERFIFKTVASVDEIDRSKPFGHTYIRDNQNSGRVYSINSETGIMYYIGMGLMPGISGNLEKEVANMEHDAAIEFLSGYIRQPFIGNNFPDGSDKPDKQSYFGYNESSLTMTPLDTMLMRARFDELHNVNKYGNHPNLNYSRIEEPLRNIIQSAIIKEE